VSVTHLLLHPEPDTGDSDLSWLYRAIHAAETAVFDAVLAPLPGPAVPAEPSTLLANLVPRTTGIGLIAQVSAQYVAPYNQARMLNTLDNLSRGRAGWRLVDAAEDSAAALHPATTPETQRWLRAAEFVTVLQKLWESWEDGAVVADIESGVYVDADLLHPIDHSGEFFRVAGPLNLPRSPQLHPPLLVGVDSAATAELARTHADVAVLTGEHPVDAPLVLREITPDLSEPAALAARLATGDGFVLHLTAAGTELFTREVLPRLRDLGVVRDRYETSTLRGHLGLAAAVPVGVPQ